jgi:hypothetical protein
LTSPTPRRSSPRWRSSEHPSGETASLEQTSPRRDVSEVAQHPLRSMSCAVGCPRAAGGGSESSTTTARSPGRDLLGGRVRDALDAFGHLAHGGGIAQAGSHCTTRLGAAPRHRSRARIQVLVATGFPAGRVEGQPEPRRGSKPMEGTGVSRPQRLDTQRTRRRRNASKATASSKRPDRVLATCEVLSSTSPPRTSQEEPGNPVPHSGPVPGVDAPPEARRGSGGLLARLEHLSRGGKHATDRRWPARARIGRNARGAMAVVTRCGCRRGELFEGFSHDREGRRDQALRCQAA